jgi:(E)-4-hydroxy-3-methylbut-2-enyl-diphosphate synthase
MMEEGMNYPIHLGVTEAGDGEDGRIKSAVGIGTLLEDGIGDTVRVSLTEEPEAEIPVARELVERYNRRKGHKEIRPVIYNPVDPFDFRRRSTNEVDKIGFEHVPVVIISADEKVFEGPEGLKSLDYIYSENLDKWNIGEMAPDYIYLGSKDIDYKLPGTLKKIFDYNFWSNLNDGSDSFPLFTIEEFLNSAERSQRMNFLKVTLSELTQELILSIKDDKKLVLILETDNEHAMAELRRDFIELMNNEITAPVIINRNYALETEKLMLYSSTDIGGLLLDGLGDGIWITSKNESLRNLNSISFGILQATRTRISKTEYISCPSCGRTLFDLQETTAMIRKRTDHLKGLKIAIMGCIVNGPGEMADADYGYVGSGPGKITLYKGKEVVKKNINTEIAVDELINLIRDHGDWIEPS